MTGIRNGTCPHNSPRSWDGTRSPLVDSWNRAMTTICKPTMAEASSRSTDHGLRLWRAMRARFSGTTTLTSCWGTAWERVRHSATRRQEIWSSLHRLPAKRVYRALYAGDTWRVTHKLTLNLGVRYELAGPWSERFNRLTYFNPQATNAAVSGCSGTAGSSCPGDLFLV